MDKQKFFYVSYIKTTPDILWKALTSTEFSRQYWMGNSIQCDWKVESLLQFTNSDGVVVNQGKVLIADKPKTLSYTWNPQTNGKMRAETPSRVTFHLEYINQLVKLTVTHDEFIENSKIFPQISIGWPLILSSLKSMLETGNPLLYESLCENASNPKETQVNPTSSTVFTRD